MQSKVPNSLSAESNRTVNDLGPLAWVLDELRKSLEGAAKALKRFVWDAEAARGSDLAALDASQLRIARQQLHQAVGALEMVGLPAAAPLLRAMEAIVQKFIVQPEHCNQDAVAKIEYASFAITEYLESVLADKPVSAVSLFPQYRDVQTLLRADRIHPADLWPMSWRWIEPSLTTKVQPHSYDAVTRATLDQNILQLMKGRAPQAAQQLADLSLGFSAHQTDKRIRIFWLIAAGYFEALAHDLLNPDLYVRRAASRILLQYASLAKGDTSVSDRLAQDLLFFCAQATSSGPQSPTLAAVRTAYGIGEGKPVDYELVQFGRFDPALLAQARKRITLAKESWSSLSAGDTSKAKLVTDQFALVSDSLVKLHPTSEPLAHALSQAIDHTVQSGQTPRIELAMEVATSVLYLEAAFEDLDPNDPELAVRTTSLAQRLNAVNAGGDPQPLESWMEELYSRVSDKQTMGSVVGELRVSLGELEKTLDAFFRNPQDKASLQSVPGKLTQMRGVLSVLGLDQATRAVMHMKSTVEAMLDTEIDEQQVRTAGTFEHLGNNLGALSFLIDMLNYQPALAKKLFVYDEEKGELKPLMGRTHSAVVPKPEEFVDAPAPAQEMVSLVQDVSDSQPADLGARLDSLATHAALAEQPELAKNARDAALAVSGTDEQAVVLAMSTLAQTQTAVAPAAAAPLSASQEVDFEEDDLQDIFLEEAGEVTVQAQESLAALNANPADLDQLTVLRRAFHTLKGSSRMVGLNEFGEAAWALEQLFNSWLADQKAPSEEFRTLAGDALAAFERWITDISGNQHAHWSAAPFSRSADALRNADHYVALDVSATVAAPAAPAPEDALPIVEAPLVLEMATPPAAAAEPIELDAFELATSTRLIDEPLSFTLDEPAHALSPEVAPVPVAAAAPDLEDIDFDSLFPLSSAQPTEAEVAKPAPVVDAHSISTAGGGVEALELSMDEFEQHFDAPVVSAEPAALVHAEAADLTADFGDLPMSEAAASAFFEPVPEPVVEPVAEAVAPAVTAAHEPQALATSPELDSDDEKTRVIGGLRIGIPLYNVYLNEADEWSRRLVTEVAEWALEGHQPVAASSVALAHSLAGSSATVGFTDLSELARGLEHALEKSRDHHSHGASNYGQLFISASEEIRRLLHQFAAGFLKQPDPVILESLNALEFSDSILPEGSEHDEAFGLSEASESDFDSRSIHALTPSAAVEAEHTPVYRTPEFAPAAAPVMPTAVRSFVADAAQAAGFDDEEDDEIDAVDAIDSDLFPIFEEECAELMPQLGSALRQWSLRPDNRGARLEVLRVLHTLKGSARLAGALRLGEMAHRMESEIEHFGSEDAANQNFDELLTRFDRMQLTFDRLRSAQERIAAGLADPVVEPSVVSYQPAVEEAPLVADAAPHTSDDAVTNEALPATSALVPATELPRKMVVPAPQAMVMQPLRQAASASIRVRSQLLDRMVNQAGEVMITRSRLETEVSQLRGSLNDMNSNLNRLRSQLRDIEVQAESQMQSRLALAKEAQAGFDPLEFDRFTRVQELTRMMAESVNDVATVQRTLQRTIEATEDDLVAQARQTRELQRDLLRTRMVEFEGISDRLYRVVRLASKETGKQVRLDLLGGTIEMDRGMLDRLTPAFEHLLRNCVAHGIESPENRAAAGKDPIGLITVHLRQEGNDVAVDFSDDGGGLDLNRIREKAMTLGLLKPGQHVDDAEAANLIFMPGFSTAAQVTELSGRGIGMDVVRSEVNSLGGRVETTTVQGKGSHFKLVLPLTTAVTQVVMIRSGKLAVGVPANVVETVRRITPRELQQAYNSGTYDVAGEAVPFFWSGALLQASNHSVEAQTKTTPIVVFRSAAQRIAMHVDEVLGNREVVVKNLGPQLSRLPGLAGMSVLASGAVVLIYNPVALATIYGEQARALSTDRAEPHMLEQAGGSTVVQEPVKIAPVSQIPLILVVDDSITVRRVTQRLLLREGYRVSMAADGLQALERLQEERPAVVLSDIEMPRMDGFNLARNIRADDRLKDLPIVMITSRIAEKHREHAKELGVNHYLGKPYSEDELLSLVRHYCADLMAVH